MGTGAVEVREYLHTRDLATRRGVRLHAKTIVHKINLSNK